MGKGIESLDNPTSPPPPPPAFLRGPANARSEGGKSVSTESTQLKDVWIGRVLRTSEILEVT
jgi:hypothetical protein